MSSVGFFDIIKRRQRHDVLEYLDLCLDPAVRLLSSCPSQRMHSQSMCDCYCKTRASTTRQRDEIRTESSRSRGTKIVASKFRKSGSSRSGKRIPLTPAKVIDDEQQLDTKRSTVTFPVSPVLSPETSAVLEDVEKLLKDAQIQMKEISMATSAGRFRNHVNLYPDEASLDDENDQLLYIRERVASKFHEANDWTNLSQSFPNKPKKPTKIVDLTGPKFQTLEDRCKDYSRRKRVDAERFEFPASSVDDGSGNDDKTRNAGQTSSSSREIRTSKKTNACRIQTGPSLDIKGELRVQNLEGIHISPDVSFAAEKENVATYVVYRDRERRNVSPKRREKFVKILENDNSEKSVKKWTNDGKKRRNLENRRDEESNTNSIRVSEKVDTVLETSNDVSIESKEEFILDEERSKEPPEKQVRAVFRKENFELAASTDRTDSSNVDETLENENVESTEDVSCTKRDIDGKTSASSTKIVRRNEQKQVRFDEGILETRNDGNSFETVETNATKLNEDLEVSTRRNNFVANRNISRDNSELFKNPSNSISLANERKNEFVPLSSEEIEKKHSSNKRRHEEMCERRRRQHFETIDERFADILRTFANRNDGCSKANGETNDADFNASFDSTDDSNDFEELCDLYEPRTKELDYVLLGYRRIIEKAARSVETIDEFFARPEIEEYRARVEVKSERKKQFVESRPRAKRTGERTNLSRGIPVFEGRVPETKKNWNFQENDFVSNDSNKFRVRSTQKTGDRGKLWRKSSRMFETSENSSEDILGTNIKEERGTRFMETCSFQVEKDSAAFRTSSICPRSSSSETGTASDAKLSMEMCESTLEQDQVNSKSKIVQNERKNIGKVSFDGFPCSNVSKRVSSGVKNAEELIARVLREEARFVEDKTRNIFEADEIVNSFGKRLLETLKSRTSKFVAGDLELFVSQNVSSNLAAGDRTIETREENCSAIGTMKRDEKNCSAIGTMKRDEKNCSAIGTMKRDEKNCSAIGTMKRDEENCSAIGTMKRDEKNCSAIGTMKRDEENCSAIGTMKRDEENCSAIGTMKRDEENCSAIGTMKRDEKNCSAIGTMKRYEENCSAIGTMKRDEENCSAIGTMKRDEENCSAIGTMKRDEENCSAIGTIKRDEKNCSAIGTIKRDEENCSAIGTMKRDEENCSAIGTMKRDFVEVAGKTAANRLDLEEIITAASTRNSKDETSSRSGENASRSRNESSSIAESDGKSNSDVEQRKEDSRVKIGEVSCERNDELYSYKLNSKKILSEEGELSGKKRQEENLGAGEAGLGIVEQSKNEKAGKISEKSDASRNMDKKVASSDDCEFLEDAERKSLRGKNLEILHADSGVENFKILESTKDRSREIWLISRADRTVEPSNNNFSQGSSSDSLRNCASLPSSSKNSSNNTKHSLDAEGTKETLERKNIIDDAVTNTNCAGFDNNTVNKEDILSDVYDEVHRKLFSSTFETNYSSALNHHFGFSSGISTISTTESNKILLSSNNSHSEGEVCLPSSDSYSLGEIRMVAKSDLEKSSANDFDDNIPVFLTKEMLTSWNESSKSLIQSMGEI